MGYSTQTWEFLEKFIPFSDGKGQYVLDLGDQAVKDSLRIKFGKKYRRAEELYKLFGFNYECIDILGGKNVLVIDLAAEYKEDKYREKFDYVVNSGTSEHVEPFKNQYECFMNIHNFCKPGGIMLHMIPEVGGCLNHCQVYYKSSFFTALAESCGYDLLLSDKAPRKNCFLLMVALRKKKTSIFCNDREKFFDGLKFVPYKDAKVIHHKWEKEIAKIRKKIRKQRKV